MPLIYPVRPPLPFCSTLSSSGGKATWLRARSKNRGLQGIGWKSGGNWTRLGCFPTRVGSMRKLSRCSQRGWGGGRSQTQPLVNPLWLKTTNIFLECSYRVVFHLLLSWNLRGLICVWNTNMLGFHRLKQSRRRLCCRILNKCIMGLTDSTHSEVTVKAAVIWLTYLRWQPPEVNTSLHWPRRSTPEHQEDPTGVYTWC